MEQYELWCSNPDNKCYNKKISNGFKEKEFNPYNKIESGQPFKIPCEFCKRTFIPASLNKHKREYHKSLINKNDSKVPICVDLNQNKDDEFSILSIEQMLANRRKRSLNWRKRHEDFMDAVYAVKNYGDMASKVKVPLNSSQTIEPDIKPSCEKILIENGISHPIDTSMEDMTIDNNKPEKKVMRKKERKDCLIYSSPKLDMSIINQVSSKPITRCENLVLNQNNKCQSDITMSTQSLKYEYEIDGKKCKRNLSKLKKPGSVLSLCADSQSYPNSNLESKSTQFDDKNMSGSQNNLLNTSKRLSLTQSFIQCPFSSDLKNNSGKSSSCWNLKKSTSFLTSLKDMASLSNTCMSRDGEPGDVTVYNHKPFSCGKFSKEINNQRTTSKSIVQTTKLSGCNTIGIPSTYIINKEINITNKSYRNADKKNFIERNRSFISNSNKNMSNINLQNIRKPVSNSIKNQCCVFKNDSDIVGINNNLVNKNQRFSTQIKCKTLNSKLSNSNLDISNITMDNWFKTPLNNNEILKNKLLQIPNAKNTVQIQIQHNVRPEKICNKETVESNCKLSKSQITLQKSSGTNIIISKPIVKEMKENIKMCKKVDPKGECPSPPSDSRIFVSNFNLSKGYEDHMEIDSKVAEFDPKKDKSNMLNSICDLYQCRSIRKVTISDKNNPVKYRSTISLQESLNREKQSVKRIQEIPYFCPECGHKFSGFEAKFCCFCGFKRSRISIIK